MKENITAISFAAAAAPEECSAAMKALLTRLFESGTVTYDQFLFPYADSLLLSGGCAEPPHFFGSHSLLWQVEPERLLNCEAELFPDKPGIFKLQNLELSAQSIKNFFADGEAENENYILAGGFSELISGSLRPWAIREHSRHFCSFAEHISRLEGYTLCGLAGGCIALSAKGIKENYETELAEIYSAKTGGIIKIIKPTEN